MRQEQRNPSSAKHTPSYLDSQAHPFRITADTTLWVWDRLLAHVKEQPEAPTAGNKSMRSMRDILHHLPCHQISVTWTLPKTLIRGALLEFALCSCFPLRFLAFLLFCFIKLALRVLNHCRPSSRSQRLPGTPPPHTTHPRSTALCHPPDPHLQHHLRHARRVGRAGHEPSLERLDGVLGPRQQVENLLEPGADLLGQRGQRS